MPCFLINRLVDIICDKMSEQGESEQVQIKSSNSNSNGPNTRGGPSGGATRLTENTSNKSNGIDAQSCQC
jgi:hypothetical protein